MIRTLCRLLLHLFFSTVRVHNAERIPTSGPVLIVSNHHSSLVDPAMLIAVLPRTPRFLAKAVLWGPKYLPLRPFLAAARAIPVHRRKDGGGDNSDMFAASRAALIDGDVVALFGEGVSHNMAGLLDLKTGAARIARGVDGTISVVPVGIIYDDRAAYRSHVMAYVGEPIPVTGRPGGDEDRDAVEHLTDQIADGLEEVAPSWQSWHQHNDARVAARVTVSEHPELDYAEVLTTLNNAIDAGSAGGAAVCSAVHGLEGEADRLGLDLDFVAAQPPADFEAISRRTLLASFVWWPLVTLGRAINIVPFVAIRAVARTQQLNFQATLKILLGVALYPIWWLALGIVVGMLVTPAVGVAVALAAPILGYLAARKAGSLRHLTNQAAIDQLEHSSDASAVGLIARRARVIETTKTLLGPG